MKKTTRALISWTLVFISLAAACGGATNASRAPAPPALTAQNSASVHANQILSPLDIQATNAALSASATQVIKQGPPRAPLPPLNGSLISQGSAIYAQNCARCHGVNLEGQTNWQTVMPGHVLPPPLNSAGHAWQHTDFEIKLMMQNGGGSRDINGNKLMPSFQQTVTPDDAKAVIEFLKSTWGDTERAYQIKLSTTAP